MKVDCQNVIIYFRIMYRLQVIVNASYNSSEVCERIIQTGFHAGIMENLNWGTLSADSLSNPQSDAKRFFVKQLIAILHNVVRGSEEGCSALRQCRAVDVLQKFRDAKYQVNF